MRNRVVEEPTIQGHFHYRKAQEKIIFEKCDKFAWWQRGKPGYNYPVIELSDSAVTTNDRLKRKLMIIR